MEHRPYLKPSAVDGVSLRWTGRYLASQGSRVRVVRSPPRGPTAFYRWETTGLENGYSVQLMG